MLIVSLFWDDTEKKTVNLFIGVSIGGCVSYFSISKEDALAKIDCAKKMFEKDFTISTMSSLGAVQYVLGDEGLVAMRTQ